MGTNGLEKIPTVGKLKDLSNSYYESISTARDRGDYVGYVTAVYPVEILRAMDILPFYPENYAVICAARKMTVELSDVAEAQGYARDLCSYARCGMGSIFYEKPNPLGSMAPPDFLLPCNTQCGTLTKWFEAMGKILDAPVVLLDAPFVRGAVPYRHGLQYFIDQLRELVWFLEERIGKKLDLDRLREVLNFSAQACALWNEVLDLAQNQPAPWTIFDEYIHMAPIVTHRGTKECVDYYRELRAFLIRRVSDSFAAVPTEKHRFYWDNIPMWFRLRPQSELMASHGVAVLASLYTHSWAYCFDTKDPYKSLAENYLRVFSNMDIERRTALTLDLMDRYSLNGYIFHSNRSCKSTAFGIYDIMGLISEKTAIPGLIFEADMGDPRYFSEEQYKLRLETYLELLETQR